MTKSAASKNLVLVGGGHSHAIVLELFAKKASPDANIILISDVDRAPYSGMLPGHVAGFYRFEECHIDLKPLCDAAGAKFYRDRAIGLDLENNRLLCENGDPIPFDVLSLDIGSTPAKSSVPGVEEYTTPAKPVPNFLQHWQNILDRVSKHPEEPIAIAIVGGGAGGVELAFNAQTRIQTILERADRPPSNLTIHLFHRGSQLMEGHAPLVRTTLEQILRKRGIDVHLNENVTAIEPGCTIRCESGLEVESDRVFWVTQASSPDWIANSKLATSDGGFILIGETLQSLSHPHIFAAGDIATMQSHPRPKAGVFAVRQGQPLFENLRNSLQNKALKTYIPQKNLLALIGTGDERAIASRGNIGFGPCGLLWKWKDRIDRDFMQRFEIDNPTP